jgi:hypothetical protein
MLDCTCKQPDMLLMQRENNSTSTSTCFALSYFKVSRNVVGVLGAVHTRHMQRSPCCFAESSPQHINSQDGFFKREEVCHIASEVKISELFSPAHIDISHLRFMEIKI